MKECLVFQNEDLLPEAWRHLAGAGPLRTFNPGLIDEGSSWIFAYRVVAGPDWQRRIALCRLDAQLNIIPGSQIPLSDQITFEDRGDDVPETTTWFADPRLYRFGNRIFVYWNSGWHEPRNHQFLQELEPISLRPLGRPRELNFPASGRKLEKNWMLFGEERTHAVYSVSPYRILDFSLDGDGPIAFRENLPARNHQGTYATHHGGLRGGAPPQRVGEHYYAFCHSVHAAPEGYRYEPAVFRFSAQPPFELVDLPTKPLALGNPFGLNRTFPKLNPAVGEVIYPSGAIFRQDMWHVSYGINDEHCAIALVSPVEVTASLQSATLRPDSKY